MTNQYHYWKGIEDYWRIMEAQANAHDETQLPELQRRAGDLWVLIHTVYGVNPPYRAHPDKQFIEEYKPKGLSNERDDT